MTFDEYSKGAATTALYPKDRGVEYTLLGLVGEAGELANHYKKAIRDDGGALSDDRRQKLVDELGDVLWYLARLSDELGTTLDDVARRNLDKLRSRAERGKIGGSGDTR